MAFISTIPELVTLAAARALPSSYCMLAHGSVLRQNFYSSAQLNAIAQDYHTADLTPAEVAMMAYAEQIVRDATAVTQADIDELRAHGFSDTEIFDIAATATARCFFSKTLDALGAEPDAVYLDLDKKLRQTLTVGRPISGTAYHGQGIGQQLFDHALDFARSQQYEEMTLTTHPLMKRAHRFYERNGFRRVANQKHLYAYHLDF